MICYRMQLFSGTGRYWVVILFILSVSMRCIIKIKGWREMDAIYDANNISSLSDLDIGLQTL